MRLRTRSIAAGSGYRKGLYKYYVLCLLGVLAVLLFELVFTSAPATSFLGEEGMTVLVLVDLAVLTYVGYLYLSEDLEAQRLYTDDLVPPHVQRQALQSRQIYEGLRSFPHSPSPLRVSPKPPVSTPILQSPGILSTAEKLRGLTAKDSYAAESPDFIQTGGKMRHWIERVRQYLSKTLIPMVLTAHVENAELLNGLLKLFTSQREQKWIYDGSFTFPLMKLSAEETDFCKRATLPEIKLLALEVGCNYERDVQTATSYSIAGGANVQDPARKLQQSRVQLLDAIRQRAALERFFEVPGYAARDYVISRLQTLATTSCLSGFHSFSGGSQPGGQWTAKSPTDSHIVANLWFAMLINANNPTADPDFRLNPPLLHSYPAAPPYSSDPTRVSFYQKNAEEKIEPHYDVVSGKELWPAVNGTENVFCAIALFLLHVKSKGVGYYQKMNCKEVLRLITDNNP